MYIKKDNIVIKTVRTNKNLCDPMTPSKHLVTRWTNILNEEIFNNALHPFKTIEIKRKHNCHAEYIGRCKNGYLFGELSISQSFMNKTYFIYTLAHEMVHQWQWMEIGKVDHGQTFLKWKTKMNKFEIPLGVSI